MKESEKYYNFPITMLASWYGEFHKKNTFLDDAINYHIYSYSLKEEQTSFEDLEDIFDKSSDYFGVAKWGAGGGFNKAKKTYQTYKNSRVFVGVSKTMYWDFYKEEKTEHEWNCLIAHLALRSISGNKSVTKSDNTMLYARMSGREKRNEYNPSYDVNLNRYQRGKIIDELEANWNLQYYGRTRGFYFSYTKGYDELIMDVELRKATNKKKQLTLEKERIRQEVLAKIAYDNK